MPNADEWTKGIHYGLLHGLDNILDNVKPVDAIPKADYEARLKADIVDILGKISAKIEQSYCEVNNDYDHGRNYGLYMATQIIDKYKSERT